MRSGSCEAGGTADETFIHDRNFEEVFGKRSCLQVIVIRLANAAQETHWAGPSKFELQHGKHKSFRLQDLVDGVAAVDHVHNLLNRRTVDLLVFGGNENGCCSHELQFAKGDHFAREEAINVVDAQEQCLRKEVKSVMHLDEPVHQHGTHRPLDLVLVVHVVGIR